MNCPPHIFYKKSYYSNTDYLIKRNCSQCSKCNKCLYYTYTYLTKITNKYRHINIDDFVCPCPTIILKDISDETLHPRILGYLL